MLTARAAEFDLVLLDLGLPELGPHDVQMKLGAGGICGSDLHYFGHGRVGAFVIREPLVPGHEASGIVERIGSAVTRVKPGEKVAVNPSHACGVCDYCRAGRGNLCRKMFFLGSASVFPHAQGMFADQFVLGHRQVIPVDTDVSLGELAFAEPFAVGLHAVQRAGGGGSPSMCVEAATWGLVVTGKLLDAPGEKGLAAALTAPAGSALV